MSRVFKVCISGPDGQTDTIAIKPCLKNYDNFKEEIFIRIPALKTQNYKIYYNDLDGDKITIFNTLDFGIFYDSGINRVHVLIEPKKADAAEQQVFVPATEATSTSREARSTTSPTKRSAPTNNRPEASDTPLIHHFGVICDQCDKDIYGFRYKCLQCPDYDLCMSCESKMCHKDHIMLRMPDPADADLCLGRRHGKRYRLRMPKEDKEKDDEGKKRHHHRRRCGGNPFEDIVTQVLPHVFQTFSSAANGTSANASASASASTSANTGSSANQNSNAGKTSGNSEKWGAQTEAHAKNAENLAKTSIDIISNLAQNFATMMDPFAASFAFESVPTTNAATSTNSTTVTSGTNTASAATSTAATNTATTTTTSVSTSTIQPEVAVEMETETPQPSGSKPAEQASIQKSTEGSIATETSESSKASQYSLAEEGAAALQQDVEMKSPSQQAEKEGRSSISRDWTLVDANGLVEEQQLNESAGSANSAQEPSVAFTGAIPKTPSPPLSSTPDYNELSRALRAHIEDVQKQIERNDEQNSKKTQTPPESGPASEPIQYHPDRRINESLQAMIGMGFSNEGGWLAQLLESVDGNIPRALDLLQPHK